MYRLRPIFGLVLLLTTVLIIPLGCNTLPAPTTTTTPPVTYNLPQLKYLLLARYPDYFWCDPEYWPIVREGVEEQNAIEQFPNIKANTAEFTEILKHLNLPDKADYTKEEKISIYREHKTLNGALQVTPAGNIYNYTIRTGENQGWRYEGTITPSGEIKVTKKETSFNTCPICLTAGTLIDTPQGQVTVEKLTTVMTVWTLDEAGNRIAAEIVQTTATKVPADFQVVNITLSDDRNVNVSPNHPSAEGKALASYQVGDMLDGASVVSLDYVPYSGKTYDILPAGGSGLYFANGILLKSTLVR